MISWLDAIKLAQNEKAIRHELKMIDKKNKIEQKFERYLMFLTIRISEIKLIVANSEEWKQKWLTFSLLGLNSDLKINDLSKDLNFKISELTLFDELHDYKNPFLKNVLTSLNPDKKQQKELINIEIKMLDSNHPQYKNLACEINVKFGHCFINYKPLTLIRISEFVKKSLTDLKKLLPKPSKSQINEPKITLKQNLEESKIKNKLESNVVLLKLNVKWDILSISLIHYQTFLNSIELNLSDVNFLMILTAETFNIKGSLNDLTIQDLSNYPQCLYKEEDYLRIIKNEIFGKNEKKIENSILDFSFTQIISPNLIKNNIDKILDVKIHSIKSNIYVQIIMKLVDYFLIQILEVINNPDVLKNLMDSEFKNKIVSDVIQKIKNPKFMKINIFAEDLFVVLKPLPNSEEYFVVKVTKIEVNNTIINSQRQIMNKNSVMSKEDIPEKLIDLFNEIYQIFLKDFVISVQRKGMPLKNISSSLEFNLMFQGICFEKEYLFCYENLGFLLKEKI